MRGICHAIAYTGTAETRSGFASRSEAFSGRIKHSCWWSVALRGDVKSKGMAPPSALVPPSSRGTALHSGIFSPTPSPELISAFLMLQKGCLAVKREPFNKRKLRWGTGNARSRSRDPR